MLDMETVLVHEPAKHPPLDSSPLAPTEFQPRPLRVSPFRHFPWGDGVSVLALVAIVIAGWCAGTGRWNAASWQTPLKYLEVHYNDVLLSLANLKAAQEGDVLPFWKIVPRLGAPFEASWNDFPSNEDLLWGFAGAMAKLFGLFAGLHVALLIAHIAAAVVCFVVARWLDCSKKWSFIAALAFGLSPYIFAQSPHHLGVATVWHLPLFVLVWRWVGRDEGIALHSREAMLALGVALLTGALNVYYANIFCQLTLLMASASALRNSTWHRLKVPLLIVATTAFSFSLMMLDSWSYRFTHGPNPGGFTREYKWLEIYGLKIVDLFIPPGTHHVLPFAEFGAVHRSMAPLQDEGSYLGIVGLVALIALVSAAVDLGVRRRSMTLPAEAWQVLWIVLFFTTGGINAIFGAVGLTLFRTGCRYSVVILVIVLLYGARRLSAAEHERRASGDSGVTRSSSLAAGLFALIILIDQIPRAPALDDIAAVSAQVEADREFALAMEERLEPGAMVFQLPIVSFPEGPIPGVPPYDHLRPFLYTETLRFSFGSVKGRPQSDWQLALNDMPLEDLIAEVRRRGFSALYLKRAAFPDGGARLLEELRALGMTKPTLYSATGEFACVFLK